MGALGEVLGLELSRGEKIRERRLIKSIRRTTLVLPRFKGPTLTQPTFRGPRLMLFRKGKIFESREPRTSFMRESWKIVAVM
jgi:hypothetical protein